MKRKTFSTKPFKDLVKKRLEAKEIEGIEKEAKQEALSLESKSTYEQFFESLSVDEKEEFYLDQWKLLNMEIQIIKEKLKELK
jgi:hypothetical protein